MSKQNIAEWATWASLIYIFVLIGLTMISIALAIVLAPLGFGIHIEH